MKGRYFEELEVGAVYTTARVSLTEDAIIRFGFEWDPQPFHIDRMAASESMFGGLIASGYHTMLVSYRLYFDHGLLRETAMAGLGFDEVRFRKPLRPADTIKVVITVVEKRMSSKPDRGIARLKLETVNQDDEIIMSMYLTPLVACRPDGRERDERLRF